MTEPGREHRRNERLARNLTISDGAMELDEVIEHVVDRARCFMDVPGPRANQLVDEIERLRALLPPAGLPPVLATVDDVARVCEAAGLEESGDRDEWRDDLVHVWARPYRVAGDPFREVTIDIARPGQYARVGTVNPWAPAAALWHVIQAARGGAS